MDNISLLWNELFDVEPNLIERRFMEPLIDTDFDEPIIILCAIHVHILVATMMDQRILALTANLQDALHKTNQAYSIFAKGIDETLTKMQKIEASAASTESVLLKARNTMAKVDDEHHFWRRLTQITPDMQDIKWIWATFFVVCGFSSAVGSAVTMLAFATSIL